MSAIQPLSGVIKFGIFEVDLRSGELRKQGVKVRLQEQPFQILLVLLERQGEVVTREELQKRIWPADTFVDFDHGLNNAIKRLREALGDSADSPRFIETLPRRGYRFISTVNGGVRTGSPENGNGNTGTVVPWPVDREATVASSNDQQAGGSIAPPSSDTRQDAVQVKVSRRPRRGLAVAIVAGVAGLMLLTGILIGFSSDRFRRSPIEPSSPQIRSIAVLPLQNLSGDPTQESLADGMTEELITELSRLSGLKVVSRTSVMRYKKTEKSMPEIAHELDVDAIVEGTVQRSGGRVRITAQLIYGPADRHLWANSFERNVEDTLVLQSTVANEIADAIKVTVSPVKRSTQDMKTLNPRALDAYVNARFHFEQVGKAEFHKEKRVVYDEELGKAVSFLDQAIQNDPTYVPAYVAYFDALTDTPSHLEYLPKAKTALMKALELDEKNVAAHLAMGRLLSQYEYDWEGAGREYRRAIELAPNSGEAHGAYSDYLAEIGKRAESEKELAQAQALDPNHDYYADIGVARAGYTLEQQRQALEEKTPDDPFLMGSIAKNYAIAGRYKESVEMWERCLSIYGWHEFVEILKRADVKGGPKFALEEWMRAGEAYSKTHDDFPVFVMAFTYSSLGNKDRAFAWLDKAYAQRHWTIIYLKCDEVWAPLRSDPRFATLLQRAGLPQ